MLSRACICAMLIALALAAVTASAAVPRLSSNALVETDSAAAGFFYGKDDWTPAKFTVHSFRAQQAALAFVAASRAYGKAKADYPATADLMWATRAMLKMDGSDRSRVRKTAMRVIHALSGEVFARFCKPLIEPIGDTSKLPLRAKIMYEKVHGQLATQSGENINDLQLSWFDVGNGLAHVHEQFESNTMLPIWHEGCKSMCLTADDAFCRRAALASGGQGWREVLWADGKLNKEPSSKSMEGLVKKAVLNEMRSGADKNFLDPAVCENTAALLSAFSSMESDKLESKERVVSAVDAVVGTLVKAATVAASAMTGGAAGGVVGLTDGVQRATASGFTSASASFAGTVERSLSGVIGGVSMRRHKLRAALLDASVEALSGDVNYKDYGGTQRDRITGEACQIGAMRVAQMWIWLTGDVHAQDEAFRTGSFFAKYPKLFGNDGIVDMKLAYDKLDKLDKRLGSIKSITNEGLSVQDVTSAVDGMVATAGSVASVANGINAAQSKAKVREEQVELLAGVAEVRARATTTKP